MLKDRADDDGGIVRQTGSAAMKYATHRLGDKALIREFLNLDRKLTAYALGDLDDAFWPRSAFYGAWSGEELVSLVLIYAGLDPAVLTAFGEPEGVRAIFEVQPLPDEIYYLFPLYMGDLLSEYYERPHTQQEWRMVLDQEVFVAPTLDGLARLGPDHALALDELYRHAAEPGEAIVAFDPWQIAHGMFYGIWDGGALVAAAGTHVWSPAEGVAAIGNVFTRPDCRGRGYATLCTAAVAVEALRAEMDAVILNVRDGNTPAIHVYEKLGFQRYCLFWEGPGLRR
jgi:ribosomal protein S18 acetylase RimI-like enzyme